MPESIVSTRLYGNNAIPAIAIRCAISIYYIIIIIVFIRNNIVNLIISLIDTQLCIIFLCYYTIKLTEVTADLVDLFVCFLRHYRAILCKSLL